jgi:hypothetical protein
MIAGMREIESGVIEGRVMTGGVAQTVTREDGLVRIRLTCAPGARAVTYGPVTTIAFPEPVRVEAGSWVTVEVTSLPEPGRDDASQPMLMPGDVILTNATLMP